MTVSFEIHKFKCPQTCPLFSNHKVKWFYSILSMTWLMCVMFVTGHWTRCRTACWTCGPRSPACRPRWTATRPACNHPTTPGGRPYTPCACSSELNMHYPRPWPQLSGFCCSLVSFQCLGSVGRVCAPYSLWYGVVPLILFGKGWLPLSCFLTT